VVFVVYHFEDRIMAEISNATINKLAHDLTAYNAKHSKGTLTFEEKTVYIDKLIEASTLISSSDLKYSQKSRNIVGDYLDRASRLSKELEREVDRILRVTEVSFVKWSRSHITEQHRKSSEMLARLQAINDYANKSGIKVSTDLSVLADAYNTSAKKDYSNNDATYLKPKLGLLDRLAMPAGRKVYAREALSEQIARAELDNITKSVTDTPRGSSVISAHNNPAVQILLDFPVPSLNDLALNLSSLYHKYHLGSITVDEKVALLGSIAQIAEYYTPDKYDSQDMYALVSSYFADGSKLANEVIETVVKSSDRTSPDNVQRLLAAKSVRGKLDSLIFIVSGLRYYSKDGEWQNEMDPLPEEVCDKIYDTQLARYSENIFTDDITAFANDESIFRFSSWRLRQDKSRLPMVEEIYDDLRLISKE